MPKIIKNAKNHQKCKKSPKRPKITENAKNAKNHQKGQKSQEMQKINKRAKNHRKCLKSQKMPKITENTKSHQKCQKLQKIPKITKNGKNHKKAKITSNIFLIYQKSPKITKKGKNHRKWPKYGKWQVAENGPFLRAFQIPGGSHGLSARRAGRTKSRDPKGLQLEVRAQRAPRLLVGKIIDINIWDR